MDAKDLISFFRRVSFCWLPDKGLLKMVILSGLTGFGRGAILMKITEIKL